MEETTELHNSGNSLSLEAIFRYILKLNKARFFGSLLLKFEDGQVRYVKVEKTLKQLKDFENT